MSQYERDVQNARIAERKKATAEKNKPVVVVPPEPPGILAGGTRTSPTVEAARQAMLADKQKAQRGANISARFSSIVQDKETIVALTKQWITDTPGFVATPHNMQSLSNAVDEWLLKTGIISIAILNDIHDELVEGHYLEMSGHSRVRGQGIMVGRPTVYPQYKTLEEQQAEAVGVRKRGVGPNQIVAVEMSAAEARHLPLAELAARARAMRNVAAQPQASTENISEAEAREMPLSELRKRVQAGYSKGRR
jgi:hypothetical protein